MVLTNPGQVLKWVGGNIDVRVYTEGSDGDIDISEYVLGITTSGGAERWGQRFKVGTASIILDNTSGIFSADASVTKPFSMLFRPGRKVWIRTVPNPDAPTDLKPFFTGIIDELDENYDEAGYDNTAILRCSDNGAIWSGYNPSMMATPTGVQYSDVRVGAALDRMSWPAGDRDIDSPGLHRLQSSFLAQTTWEECQRAADAEGGAFFAGPDGKAVFRSRDWLTVERDAVVIDIFSVTTTGHDNPRGIAFDGTNFWTVLETSAFEGGPAPYKIRSFGRDGTPLLLYNVGNWNLVDLTWDGTWLWGVTQGLGGTAAYFVQIDPADGTVVNDPINEAWITPVDDVRGITTDMEGNFWVVDNAWVYKWVPATGTLTQVFPMLHAGGITWDGHDLYLADITNDLMFHYTVGGMRLDEGLTGSPSGEISGLAWDGRLRALDRLTEDVMQMELYRPTTVQGYLGYTDLPPYAQAGAMTEVDTNFELQRVKNQVRFARVGGTKQEANNLNSQSVYGLRSYERTDYKNSINDDVLFLAERYLSKHDVPRLRVEGATYSGVKDDDNSDLNRLLWDIRYGDLLKVKVQSGEGWYFERLVNVLGMRHRITANDWEVTLRLDDTISNYISGREALVATLDPLAWWSFDQDTTTDRSGRGHTLTWNSPPTWAGTGGPVPDLSASGVPVAGNDGIVTLDGTDDWATVADDGELTTLTDVSIEAWVYFDSITGLDYIASCGVGEFAGNYWQLYRDGARFKFWIGDNTSPLTPITSRTDLEVDTWYHVVATIQWDAGAAEDQVALSLYVDGEKGGFDQTYPETEVPVGAKAIRIGSTTLTATNKHLAGKLSEVAIYGRTLTETEVSDLSRSGY